MEEKKSSKVYVDNGKIVGYKTVVEVHQDNVISSLIVQSGEKTEDTIVIAPDNVDCNDLIGEPVEVVDDLTITI